MVSPKPSKYFEFFAFLPDLHGVQNCSNVQHLSFRMVAMRRKTQVPAAFRQG